MSLTAAQAQAAVITATKALASQDLTTLQTFNTLATTPSTTLGALATAMGALPASLGDLGRQTSLASATGIYTAFTSTIAGLVTSAMATTATVSNSANANEVALVAAQAALATIDLVTLQTFNTMLLNTSTTLTQIGVGFATLMSSLGDPGRIGQVITAAAQYNQFLAAIQALIALTSTQT